jgi:hypothetical protein
MSTTHILKPLGRAKVRVHPSGDPHDVAPPVAVTTNQKRELAENAGLLPRNMTCHVLVVDFVDDAQGMLTFCFWTRPAAMRALAGMCRGWWEGEWRTAHPKEGVPPLPLTDKQVIWDYFELMKGRESYIINLCAINPELDR